MKDRKKSEDGLPASRTGAATGFAEGVSLLAFDTKEWV